MVQQKRILGPLRVLDLVIIALVVLVGGALAYTFFVSGESDASPMQEVQADWTIVVKEVRSDLVDIVQVGDKVRLDVAAPVVGEVVEVRKQPTMVEVPDAEGNLVSQPSKLLYDLYISVHGEATYNEVNLYIDGRPYKINDSMDVYSNRWHYKGAIVTLEWSGTGSEGE